MSSNVILEFKERQLLLYSAIIEEHPWLKKILEENRKITTAIAKQLPNDQQIFLQELLPSILQLASKEWKQDLSKPVEDMGTDKSKRKKCSLCLHRENRYIFYIQNVITGMVLNVGSRCITHFEIQLNAPMSQLISEAKQSKAWYTLETYIPGIRRILESWDKYLERYPLMIPNDLEERYFNYHKSATKLFQRFLKNPENDKHIIERLQQCLENRNKIIEMIEKYMLEHKGNKLAPTKAIENWLLNNGEGETYNQLKKDNRITLQSMCKIKEPEFMKKLIPDLNSFLQNADMKITEVRNRSYELDINRGMGKIVSVLIPHEFLLREYGYYIFGIEPVKPLSLEIMLPEFGVYREETYNEIILYLKDELRKYGMSIEHIYLEFDDMIIKASEDQFYKVDSLRTILPKHLGLVFGYGNVIEFVKEVKSKKPMSKADKKEFDNNRKKQ